ncbi:unnamed protein product [Prunus armeniaca]|uniref:Uncharacterized protein n=1 Tax=Prunus armeniaca TaxID=36596 RepID=A0A6J5XDC5_PRUAR|nr:unnamed protein product [Prunus armeniaca]
MGAWEDDLLVSMCLSSPLSPLPSPLSITFNKGSRLSNHGSASASASAIGSSHTKDKYPKSRRIYSPRSEPKYHKIEAKPCDTCSRTLPLGVCVIIWQEK